MSAPVQGGLTDADIDQVYEQSTSYVLKADDYPGVIAFARAIEQHVIAIQSVDLVECQASNRQAWGICDAVAEALGDDLDRDVGSAESIKRLRASQSAAPVAALCPTCRGNDGDMPCAYPSEGMRGCIRDKRRRDQAASGSAQPTSEAAWQVGLKGVRERLVGCLNPMGQDSAYNRGATSSLRQAIAEIDEVLAGTSPGMCATHATAVTGAQAGASDAALKFSDHIINSMFEGDDWGGGDVQELAVKYGLLKPEERPEPCGESCKCAQNGAEFPSICYRKTYLAAIKAMAPGEKP